MNSKCTLKAESALDAKFNAVRKSRSLRNKGPKTGDDYKQYKAFRCEQCDAWHVTEQPVVQSKTRHHSDVLIPAIT